MPRACLRHLARPVRQASVQEGSHNLAGRAAAAHDVALLVRRTPREVLVMQVQRITSVMDTGTFDNRTVMLTLACCHQLEVKRREYALRVAPLGTVECQLCPDPPALAAPWMEETACLEGSLKA